MSTYRYSIRIDAPRNVLYLVQEGHAEAADLLRMQEEYSRALQRMLPGFVLVHDQRGVTSFSDDALDVGKGLVALTNEARAAKVIRIAPEGLAPRTRVTRVLVAAHSRYENVRVSTPEEAERLVTEAMAARTSPQQGN